MEKKIPDLQESNKGMKQIFEQVNHNQPGDPVKAAQAIVEALTGTKELPARLPLGSDALAVIEQSLEEEKKTLQSWGALARSTDFK